MRIHQLLHDGNYPNCTSLAKEFEVATRTIKRDIDFMKYRLDLPLEYDSRRYGFYYTRKVDQFPSLPVTEAEMFSLLVAHKAIAQYRGTPFQKPLETAFRKLTSQLDTSARFTLGNLGEVFSFRPFAPEDTDLETFQILTRALQEQRAVKFLYKNLGAAKAQQRQVHPYHLACIENLLYLFAFDAKRQAMRTFVLTRLSKPELTDQRFALPKKFDPNEYLRGSFSVFKGEDDFEVVIDFDVWGTDLIRGRKWHASQELIVMRNGSSRLRVRLNNIEEMERWVLSWGTHATVIRPIALAERIQKTVAELQKRYQKQAERDSAGKAR